MDIKTEIKTTIWSVYCETRIIWIHIFAYTVIGLSVPLSAYERSAWKQRDLKESELTAAILRLR